MMTALVDDATGVSRGCDRGKNTPQAYRSDRQGDKSRPPARQKRSKDGKATLRPSELKISNGKCLSTCRTGVDEYICIDIINS